MIAQPNSVSAVIVGESDKTRHIKKLVHKVGQGRWPVLLLGETGTGKEVVARSIHNVNPEGPFVTIDCSSLVGPLMESELFGHMRGAFTGAVTAKLGLMELANGGTAFLDEIGELPLDMQAKLLRVLQEKEFRPVGSLASKRSDFRIIAATNRELSREVERGGFRRDLYYRLNVVTIRISPLRDRSEDIIELIHFFLGKCGRGHRLTQDVVDAMLAYDWPGNVRELENCIQQMVAIHSGPLLHVTDLPSPLQNFLTACKAQSLAVAAGASCNAVFSGSMGMEPVQTTLPVLPLSEVERRAILHALDYTNGDRSVAANLLGIGRTTLYRKLKEYQIAV